MESFTRSRLSGMLVAVALAAAFAGGIARASVGPIEQNGVFALLGGAPRIVSKFWAVHGPDLTATLKVRQFRLDGTTPILDYDVDMERLMHVIVVRDDFATFAHLHPDFDITTGTFSVRFTKTPNHRFYVYADSEPRGVKQQVFRFTIDSDGPLANAPAPVAASAATSAAGPYSVALAQTTIPANQPLKLKVTITKGGRPARGLGTYLGAAAHAVFINASTLAYVHLHPTVPGTNGNMTDMPMGMGGPAGALMQMALPALPAGTYKLWFQFRGANDKVYAVPFTMRSQ